MSQFSETVGSFTRTGNYPLEANYIFDTFDDLKKFYEDKYNAATLHEGLLKVVKNDENNEQSLYWVINKDNKLQFTRLSGDFDNLKEIVYGMYRDALKTEGDFVVNDTNTKPVIPKNKRIYIGSYINPDLEYTLEIPEGCELAFGRNGKLGPNVTIRLNNTAIIASPNQQIFNDCKIIGKFKCPFIPVEWFGAKGDGITDDSKAINTCFLYAGRTTVLLSAERYLAKSTIRIDEEECNMNNTEDESYMNDGQYGMQVVCKGSIWGGDNTSPVLHINMSQLTFKCDGAIVSSKYANVAVECNTERHSDIYINRIMKGRDYSNTLSSVDDNINYNWFNGIGFFHIGGNSSRIQINTMFGFKYGYRASTEMCNQYYISWMSNKITLGTIIAPYPIYIWLASDNEGTSNPTRHNSFYHNNDITIQSNSVGWNPDTIVKLMQNETDSSLVTLKSESGFNRIAVNIYIQTVDCATYKVINAYHTGECNFKIYGSFNDVSPIRPNGTTAKNCINNVSPYTDTNKFINIIGCTNINIETTQAILYDWIYVKDCEYVRFNSIQSKYDIKDYYILNTAKLNYPVIFRPSKLLSDVNADISLNDFSNNGMYAFIDYLDLSNYKHTIVDPNTMFIDPGIYVFAYNSNLWAINYLPEGQKKAQHIGYTQAKYDYNQYKHLDQLWTTYNGYTITNTKSSENLDTFIPTYNVVKQLLDSISSAGSNVSGLILDTSNQLHIKDIDGSDIGQPIDLSIFASKNETVKNFGTTTITQEDLDKGCEFLLGTICTFIQIGDKKYYAPISTNSNSIESKVVDGTVLHEVKVSQSGNVNLEIASDGLKAVFPIKNTGNPIEIEYLDQDPIEFKDNTIYYIKNKPYFYFGNNKISGGESTWVEN